MPRDARPLDVTATPAPSGGLHDVAVEWRGQCGRSELELMVGLVAALARAEVHWP